MSPENDCGRRAGVYNCPTVRTSLFGILCFTACACYGGALTNFGAEAIRKAAPGAKVSITVDPNLGAEAFRIRGNAITGGDERGAMYGALDYAEQVELHGAARDKDSKPSLGVRALKFNVPLPGTGYLSEEDLAHNQWFWDLNYWQTFFDMAARNRYNAITFWSAHPFDRMTRIPKYPEATDVPPAELDRNIAFFRSLFQMAADRGLDVYMVTWNIHVSRAFAKAHNVPLHGFDSPLVRDYNREAIKALFATYPTLTGVGTTVGERMPNMTLREKLDWVAETYISALKEIGRPAPFILRYWQSEPEEMARMLDRVKYPGPVYLDIKFNGEHMYSSTKPHVEDERWVKLAPGRWKLLWHLRNDCVFILRWGDPDFARAALENMRGSAGFVEGSELDVPGVDRIHTPEAAAHLDWRYKFEKHWFRYMLWGRLGYATTEPDATWRAHYTRRFGAAGANIFEATRQASKIIPSVTAYHWNYMNGDWYPEGSIGTWNTAYEQPRVNYRRATMYHDIRTYIFNTTIDDSLTGIPEFIAGKRGGEGPMETAARIEGYGRRVLELMQATERWVEGGRKEWECTKADLEATGNLGIYYAEKLRGAAELARVVLDGNEKARPAAVGHLEKSLAAWRKVVAATAPHYITHEVWLFGQFDWGRYTPDVEGDIRIAREARAIKGTYDAEGLNEWLEYIAKLRGVVTTEARATEAVRAEVDVVSTGTGLKAGSESITGARDYAVSPNPGPTFRVKLPAAGEYELWVNCLWPEPGRGFLVVVDEHTGKITGMRTLGAGPNTPLNEWRFVKVGGTYRLGAGEHTVRFFGRQPGARINRFVLTPVGVKPE